MDIKKLQKAAKDQNSGFSKMAKRIKGELVEPIEIDIEVLRKRKKKWCNNQISKLTKEYNEQLFLNGNSDELEAERLRLSDWLKAELIEAKKTTSRKKLIEKTALKFK